MSSGDHSPSLRASQKGKGRRSPGETRWRSAAAVERRAERGALRRAEALLQAPAPRPGQPVDAPTAERLSYVEGLRLQSAPQLGDPDFVDHRNPVRGGIPAHSAASTAAQRGFNRFARRYPHLAEQVRRNPGRSSRNSYARETGGRRVAHGLLGEGLESVDENATQTASEEVLERIRQDLRSETDEDETVFVDGVPEEDGSSSSSAPTQVTRTVGGRAVTRLPEDRDTVIPEDNQTEFSEATLTHAPTSVWYSVDEEETEEAAEQSRRKRAARGC